MYKDDPLPFRIEVSLFPYWWENFKHVIASWYHGHDTPFWVVYSYVFSTWAANGSRVFNIGKLTITFRSTKGCK
jgi:hypothetical protein